MLDSMWFKIADVISKIIIVIFWLALIQHYGKYFYKKIRDKFKSRGE